MSARGWTAAVLVAGWIGWLLWYSRPVDHERRRDNAQAERVAKSERNDEAGVLDAGGTIHGLVRIAPDGIPGEGVAIAIGSTTTQTGTDGRFRMAVPSGRAILRASRDGYEPASLGIPSRAAGSTHDVGVLWLERAGRLTVSVVDSEDEPVVAARVQIAANVFHQTVATRWHEGRTDSRGRVTFSGVRAAGWRIHARADEFGAAHRSAAVGAGVTHVTVRLTEEHRLTGIVRDRDGRPHPGVSVFGGQGHFTWGPDRVPLGARAVTDADGRYELRGLAPGDVYLYAGFGEWRSRRIAILDVSNVTSWDFVVPRAGSVRGVVRDPEGAPVPRARLLGYSEEWTAVEMADEHGRFHFAQFPAGEYGNISASHSPEYESRVQAGVVVSRGSETQRDLVVHPGTTLRGVVLDETSPVPGANVTLIGRGGSTSTATDSHGRFAIGVPYEGPHLVVARREGLFDPLDPLDLELAWKKRTESRYIPDTSRPVEIRMQTGALLQGRVIDPDGAPVPNAEVEARRITMPKPNHTHTWFTRYAATDRDGRFVFRVAPHSKFYVQVRELAWRSKSELAQPGERVQLIGMAVHRVQVTGRVTSEGHPAVDIRLQCGDRHTRSDAKGRFTFVDVPATGRVLVAAVGVHQYRGSVAAVVPADSDRVELNLTLAPAEPWSGRVVDERGRAIAGAAIRGETPRTVIVRSDLEGRFAIPHARLFSRYTVSAEGYIPQPIAKSGERIVLRRAQAVAGVVQRRDGKPVANVSIVYKGEWAWTNDLGRFRIEGVPAGTGPLAYQGFSSRPIIVGGTISNVEAGRLNLVIEAEAGGAIAGTVRGLPDGDYSVRVAGIADADSDLDGGRFELRGLPLGNHRVEVVGEVEGPNESYFVVVASRAVVSTGVLDLRFKVDVSGVIEGTWNGPGHAWVRAYPPGAPRAAGIAAPQDGRFRIERLVPGRYELRALVWQDDEWREVDLELSTTTGAPVRASIR